MAFKSVWGFDPDEVSRAQSLHPARRGADEPTYGTAEEQAARIPSDVWLQIYELRRMFRL
jgi:hypothetical protein